MTLALVSPLTDTERMHAWPVKKSMIDSGFFDETRKSMSRTISLWRRRLPAVLQRMTPECAAGSSPVRVTLARLVRSGHCRFSRTGL